MGKSQICDYSHIAWGDDELIVLILNEVKSVQHLFMILLRWPCYRLFTSGNYAGNCIKIHVVLKQLCVLIGISVNFVHNDPACNGVSLTYVMAWRRIDAKPFSETIVAMSISAPRYKCNVMISQITPHLQIIQEHQSRLCSHIVWWLSTLWHCNKHWLGPLALMVLYYFVE